MRKKLLLATTIAVVFTIVVITWLSGYFYSNRVIRPAFAGGRLIMIGSAERASPTLREINHTMLNSFPEFETTLEGLYQIHFRLNETCKVEMRVPEIGCWAANRWEVIGEAKIQTLEQLNNARQLLLPEPEGQVREGQAGSRAYHSEFNYRGFVYRTRIVENWELP